MHNRGQHYEQEEDSVSDREPCKMKKLQSYHLLFAVSLAIRNRCIHMWGEYNTNLTVFFGSIILNQEQEMYFELSTSIDLSSKVLFF